MYILLPPAFPGKEWLWKVPDQGAYVATRRPFGHQIQTQHNHSPPSRIRQLYSNPGSTIKHRMEGEFRLGRLVRCGAPGSLASSRPLPGAGGGPGRPTAVGHRDRPEPPPAEHAGPSCAPATSGGCGVLSVVPGGASGGGQRGLLPDGALRQTPSGPARSSSDRAALGPAVRSAGSGRLGGRGPGQTHGTCRSGRSVTARTGDQAPVAGPRGRSVTARCPGPPAARSSRPHPRHRSRSRTPPQRGCNRAPRTRPSRSRRPGPCPAARHPGHAAGHAGPPHRTRLRAGPHRTGPAVGKAVVRLDLRRPQGIRLGDGWRPVPLSTA
jgi:hypothetical protein